MRSRGGHQKEAARHDFLRGNAKDDEWNGDVSRFGHLKEAARLDFFRGDETWLVTSCHASLVTCHVSLEYSLKMVFLFLRSRGNQPIPAHSPGERAVYMRLWHTMAHQYIVVFLLWRSRWGFYIEIGTHVSSESGQLWLCALQKTRTNAKGLWVI